MLGFIRFISSQDVIYGGKGELSQISPNEFNALSQSGSENSSQPLPSTAFDPIAAPMENNPALTRK